MTDSSLAIAESQIDNYDRYLKAFDGISTRETPGVATQKAIEFAGVGGVNFRFLRETEGNTKRQFHSLYNALQKKLNDGEDSKEYDEKWLECLTYCQKLSNLYVGRPDKADGYNDLLKKIKYRCENGKFEEALHRTRIQRIKKDAEALKDWPKHISNIRTFLTFTHLYRIHYVFCRLAVKYMIFIADELQFLLKKMGRLLHGNQDVESIIGVIDSVAFASNCLSVGAPALRFILDSSQIVKHTLRPSKEEEVLGYELELFNASQDENALVYNKLYYSFETEDEKKVLRYRVKHITDGKLVEGSIPLKSLKLNDTPGSDDPTPKQLKSRLVKILNLTAKNGHTQKPLTGAERFAYEAINSSPALANDSVWATVNALSNFAQYMRISAPVAAWLTAGFLIFDVALLSLRLYLEGQDNHRQEKAYRAEWNYHQNLLDEAISSKNEEEQKKQSFHLKMLEEKRKQQEIMQKTTCATLQFNIAAATLFMCSFGAVVLFANPISAAVCMLLGAIAVAMYLSADKYGAYQEKRLQVANYGKDPVLKQAGLDKAKEEALKACKDFWLAMAENTIMPLLLVTTFAVCWQAALVLTAVYLLWKTFSRYIPSEKAKPPSTVEGEVAAGTASEVVAAKNREDEGSETGLRV